MSTTTSTTAVAAPSQGPTVIIVSAIFLGLNVFFIGLRSVVKATISKNFGLNDVAMMVAVLTVSALFALLVEGVKSGVGSHTSSATIVGVSNSLKFIFFLEIIYVILTSVMKASLAASLLQWAKKKSHIYLLYLAIFLDIAICTFVVLYFLLECKPISFKWDFINPANKGTCLPENGEILVGFALCSVTISIDMLFLFIPFFMLKGRGVDNRLKLYIYGIFGLGVLASVANFIRLAALVKLKSSDDPLFDAAPVFLWSALEVSIGISVAGIIELRPLMRKLNVKGFEDSFDQIDEDMRPIRLQSMDKSTISFPIQQEHEVGLARGPSVRGGIPKNLG
ncbi:hypothetical protein L207DRAFT_491555 [Hyaloscypha variabilis F]|uniref:Rhodopsin domain-containing protein n=1 Tax=Hyaloscypha variabilis (strain UAMH 11265 / GT02V1 / F) TaxID=1149755 RepID=A0A2J6RHG3_HYAVF|nr:hypothetical protein L207DRAFT_491555 [Hyaloscypha variabilis F]